MINISRIFPKALIVLCSAFLVLANSQAADHRDSPSVISDPVADMGDVYTFMNPNDANELILIVTVFPGADAQSRFSDAVSYNFFLENNADPVESFQISCAFSADQMFTCSGPADISVVGQAGGGIASNGGMRVFAGLRDDPFFLDGDALNQTLATLTPSFTDPGNNTFAGMNILTIAIGINRGLVTNNFTAPVLKVWANTERTSS